MNGLNPLSTLLCFACVAAAIVFPTGWVALGLFCLAVFFQVVPVFIADRIARAAEARDIGDRPLSPVEKRDQK